MSARPFSASRTAVLLLALTLTAALGGLAATATPARAATPDPVVFVHGFSGAAWNWADMAADFRADGWPADRVVVWQYNSAQSNATTAGQLRALVDDVRSRTGAAKVDIVTHSMGGLSSRWYLKFLGGTAAVDDWVSIGGPNHGTNLAGFCSIAITSCKEMSFDSSFLTTLNAGDETPGSVNYGTLWSPCDEIINPDTSTVLSGAVNTRLGCVGHLSLLISNDVSQRTRTFVR